MKTVTLMHAPGSPVLPRIDLVVSVLRTDCSCALVILRGTPAMSPMPPKIPLSEDIVHWVLMAEKWIAPASTNPTTTLLV